MRKYGIKGSEKQTQFKANFKAALKRLAGRKVTEKMKKCEVSPQFNHFRYRNPRIWFEKDNPVEDRPVNFCE